MPEKKVILCEGIHDVLLFSIILEQKRINHKIVTHDELEQTREAHPENNKINDFLGRKGHSLKFLMKDENGYAKCVDSFIELYKDKDESYLMFLILDAPAFSYLKSKSLAELKKDILKKITNNFYQTKDKINHRIFLIPESLEIQVKQIIGKNLDYQDRDRLKRILEEFIIKCRKDNIDWYFELENIIINN
ncbi:MAG: hypothetical protein PHF57_07780 [Methanoregula sp.]|jgi:hypothetical protein|nr:hypothetical protein [Methanoregula sp.]